MAEVEDVTKSVISQRLVVCDARDDPRVKQLFRECPLKYRRAAVFIGLIQRADTLHVLLTLRSSTLRFHADTVSFPGGKVDDEDQDEIETALREAREEIGLDSSKVEVLCSLPPMTVSPDYLTTAVVGFVNDDFNPQINRDEVAEVFYLPLQRFLDDRGHTTRVFDKGSYPGAIAYIVHSFSDVIDGETRFTWGFTATLCCIVAGVVYNRAGFTFLDKSPISLSDPFQQYIEMLQSRFRHENTKEFAKM